MTIDQLVLSLYKVDSNIHIVYTSDNDPNAIVMRIYLRSVINLGTFQDIHEFANQLLTTVVRGVQGIVSAYVDNNTSTNKITC